MPRVVNHEAQRTDLLSRAFEIFADRGYAATSMRELAKGLGVSTGTLYHYFAGKDDIFEQMVTWTSERDIVSATASIRMDGTQLERVRSVVEWIESNRRYLQRRLMLVFEFRRHRQDEAGLRLVQNAAEIYRETFSAVLGVSGAAWSLMVGMLIRGLLEGNEPDVDAHLLALELLVSTANAEVN